MLRTQPVTPQIGTSTNCSKTGRSVRISVVIEGTLAASLSTDFAHATGMSPRPSSLKPYHFTNHTLAGLRPFLKRAQALTAWNAFREGLSAVKSGRLIAGILMPDHYHFVILTHRPHAVRRELGAIQSGLSRSGQFHHKSLWRRPPREVDLIHDAQKLANVIRYVHLNPCRKRLTDDPWSWEFSTVHEYCAAHKPSRFPFSAWLRDTTAWFDTYFRNGRDISWNSWCEEMLRWMCSDATVRPHLIELRDYQWRSLASLSQLEMEMSLMRLCSLRSRDDLKNRGSAKDLWVRLFLHRQMQAQLQPHDLSLRSFREELRMKPHRMNQLLTQCPVTREEVRWVEHFAHPFFHD